jgi:hypothetical protein
MPESYYSEYQEVKVQANHSNVNFRSGCFLLTASFFFFISTITTFALHFNVPKFYLKQHQLRGVYSKEYKKKILYTVYKIDYFFISIPKCHSTSSMYCRSPSGRSIWVPSWNSFSRKA